MHNRLRMLAAGVLVASAGVVALVSASTPAQAAPVAVAGCTAGVTVTVDDAAFANGAMVPVHDNQAGVLYPAPTDSAMSSPVCGVRRLADGSFQREWLYCTAADLNTCGTDPMVRKGTAATGVGALTDVDRAHLAWLLETQVDNSTFTTRVRSQRLVWCVTEGQAANAPAPEYYKNGSDPALTCPNWPAIDPTLKTITTLTLAGPTAPVAVGATAQFTLHTNASPIAVTPNGLTGLAVCAGTTGASLAGDVLTVAAPDATKAIALCASRTTAGNGSLKASVAQRTGATLEFWQRNANTQFCQGMLSTSTLAADAVAATAQVTFAADATTTTVAPPTTVGATTTVATGATTTAVLDTGATTTTTLAILDTIVPSPQATLPRTGTGAQDGAFWALVLLLAGVCLAALGRRGAHD